MLNLIQDPGEQTNICGEGSREYAKIGGKGYL